MRLRRVLIVVLIFVAATVFCCGAGLFKLNQIVANFTLLPNACDPTTPENTEEIGQFKFPPSARILQSSCFGMQGFLGYAQFEMSPDDLDYFVSHSHIETPLSDSIIPDDDDMATRVSSLKSFLHGKYDTTYKNGDTFSQSIFIDTSDPKLYLVAINFSGG